MLHSEFTNMWETAFDVTDTTFNCNVNRTKGTPSTQLYTINHFLDKIILGQDAPDPEAANVTNGVSGVGSLGQQVQTCAAQNGRNPNFMLVDVSKISGVNCQTMTDCLQYYEFGGGSVFQVAATANGVTYNPSTPVPTPRSTNAQSSSGATSTPNGAVLHFEARDLFIPAILSLGLLTGTLTVL
jgi:hypothetical protein